MEGEDGGPPRLGKRFKDGNPGSGEVDYKTKSGTAWSHSYLNQKPWHPLSYPNQRRKWIAEQTHAHRERRAEEVAREYAQEQDFFRQTSLVSKKEKEKMEMMQAVSFMYVKPPGYNPESAKAAELADEMEDDENIPVSEDPLTILKEKKQKPKDVFGRALPTEEEFAVLKDAPRLETGAPARVKPFAVEVRNVRCVRCGNFGHQSGDRECPLKDKIMPNEQSRLKRDDPLTAIMANMDPTEPLTWELKQKPGLSPPRGGFDVDDPNQQIIAEDIFDEYGGFLGCGDVPELLAGFDPGTLRKSSKKKGKRRRDSSSKKRRHDSCSDSEKEGFKRNGKQRRRHDSCSDFDEEGSKRNAKQRRRQDSASDSEKEGSKRNGKHKRKRYCSQSDDDRGRKHRHSLKHRHRRVKDSKHHSKR